MNTILERYFQERSNFNFYVSKWFFFGYKITKENLFVGNCWKNICAVTSVSVHLTSAIENSLEKVFHRFLS